MTTLLAGTFFAMEPQAFAAMLMVQRLGEQLAEKHPELADLYRDTAQPFSSMELGKKLLGPESTISEGVTRHAVYYALKLLMPDSERAEITRIRRSDLMHARWDFDSPAWREHCKKAATIRHSRGIGVDVQAMLQGRGRLAWSIEEKIILLQLCADPAHWTPRMVPDHVKIAKTLNTIFHGGQTIRYENSCRSMIADHRRKFRKKT